MNARYATQLQLGGLAVRTHRETRSLDSARESQRTCAHPTRASRRGFTPNAPNGVTPETPRTSEGYPRPPRSTSPFLLSSGCELCDCTHAALLVSQALSFTPKHQHSGTSVANLAIVLCAVGRGPDDLYAIQAYPTPELLGSRSYNRLLEERSHSRADYDRIERV